MKFIIVFMLWAILAIAMILSITKDLIYYKQGYERCVKQMNTFILNDIESRND